MTSIRWKRFAWQARTLGAAATGYKQGGSGGRDASTETAQGEVRTIEDGQDGAHIRARAGHVEDALRAYLETPGSKPGSMPPQTSGEISFGNLGGPTLPNWGGGAKKRRKS